MANGILGYEGDIPASVTKAAQKALSDWNTKARNSLAYTKGVPESVTKAAQKRLAAERAKSFEFGPKQVKGILSKEAADYVGGQAPEAAAKVAQASAPKVASAVATGSGLGTLFTTLPDAVGLLQGNKEFSENPRLKSQMGMDKESYVGAGLNASPIDKPLRDVTREDILSGLRSLNSSGTPEAPKAEPAAQPTVPEPIVNQVVQQKATEVEQKRQTVEAGAKAQLRTNSLSRPKAAEAVVKADVQRTGETITPEQFKSRVVEETTAMKNMDDDQLSKYLSYALIAGGLIASAVDENAGNAFAEGFNAQVDRNQQMEMFTRKEEAAAKAAAQEAALAERKLGVQEADVASKIESREGNLDLSREELSAKRENWDRNAQIANAKLGLMSERNAIERGKSDSTTSKSPYLSFKDNKELLKSYADGNDLNLDDGALEAGAQRLQTIQQQGGDLTAQEQLEILLEEFQLNPGEKNTWWPDKDASYGFKTN